MLGGKVMSNKKEDANMSLEAKLLYKILKELQKVNRTLSDIETCLQDLSRLPYMDDSLDKIKEHLKNLEFNTRLMGGTEG